MFSPPSALFWFHALSAEMFYDQPWHRGEEHMMHECLNSHNSYHMFQRVSHRHLHTIKSSAQEIFRVSNQLDLHVFKENPQMQGQNLQTPHRIH